MSEQAESFERDGDLDRAVILDEFFAGERASRRAIAAALPAAREGICRIAEACAHKTGQSYHLRALLFSLWNGKPTRLIEIVNLDQALRMDLLAVLAVFGCDAFFYAEIQDAFKRGNLFEWFLEESEEERA
jgi:hypothetical protein